MHLICSTTQKHKFDHVYWFLILEQQISMQLESFIDAVKLLHEHNMHAVIIALHLST